jgi:hypothetical protein
MDIAAHLERYGRPGIPWRGATITTWIAVLLCLVAFAISSRTVGRPVWWLGPSGNDAPFIYKLVPIALAITPIEGAIWRSRTTIPAAIVCSLGLIAIALPDLSHSPGIAIGMVVVGIAALLQSIALVVVTRQYR